MVIAKSHLNGGQINKTQMSDIKSNQLNTLLDKFPRFKLGDFPTPLYKCENIEKSLGLKHLYIKRDDLSGLAFGGNKVRHLEFRIGDIIKNNCDIFINSNVKVSNNSRINAAACIKAGIKYVVVMGKGPNEAKQGNYLLQKLMNVEIHELDTEDNDTIEDYCKELSEKYIKNGHKPYLRSENKFAQHSAVLGYISGAIELNQQINIFKKPNNKIKVYQVAGNSVVGMAITNKYCDLEWEINAISPYLDNGLQEKGIETAEEISKLLNINTLLNVSDINYNFDYVGEDYGIITQGAKDAIKFLARKESVFLDPIYTAKCMDALLNDIHKNKFSEDDIIIFIHSGGTPNIFTYVNDLIL